MLFYRKEVMNQLKSPFPPFNSMAGQTYCEHGWCSVQIVFPCCKTMRMINAWSDVNFRGIGGGSVCMYTVVNQVSVCWACAGAGSVTCRAVELFVWYGMCGLYTAFRCLERHTRAHSPCFASHGGLDRQGAGDRAAYSSLWGDSRSTNSTFRSNQQQFLWSSAGWELSVMSCPLSLGC